MVQGIIAGGKEAMFESQEGAEDDKDEARRIIGETVCAQDVVCGLAASGRTPFVVSALAEAQKKGAFTILITTNNREQLQQLGVVADCFICPNVGPEVLTGSTRLKSGTAQKMVLNMLTTASMVRLGKVFGNVMVDLQSTNKKLVERSKKVIMETTGLTYQEASDVLRRADGHVKTAIVMTLLQVEQDSAREMLDNAQGFVQEVLAQYKR
jgi:N-acetylmuramic acid 6-phosphate etherase